jgi:kinesin family protein 3/17
LCRAKNIKNQAVVNEDADQRTLLRKYERELRRLRAELTRRNKELVDKRHLLEVRGFMFEKQVQCAAGHRCL